MAFSQKGGSFLCPLFGLRQGSTDLQDQTLRASTPDIFLAESWGPVFSRGKSARNNCIAVGDELSWCSPIYSVRRLLHDPHSPSAGPPHLAGLGPLKGLQRMAATLLSSVFLFSKGHRTFRNNLTLTHLEVPHMHASSHSRAIP